MSFAANTVGRIGRSTIAAILGMSLSGLAAQEHRDLGHGALVIERALELVQANDSSKADALLGTVHRSDSLYERAMLIRAQLATYQDRLADARIHTERGASVNGTLTSDLLTMRAAVLYDQKEHAACIAACDSLIARYPGRFRAYHLKAMAMWEKGDRGPALDQFMANAKRFPYQRDTHGFIALKAADQGYTSLSALAGTMALVVRYGDDKAEQLLTLVDGVLGGTVEPKDAGQDFGPKDELMIELDELIKSRVAMNDRYAVKPDLSYPICRQSHVLFTELSKRSIGSESVFAYYVPLVQEIMARKVFEGFVYSCLASSSYENVRGLAEKNKSKVSEFRSLIGTFVQDRFVTFPDTPGAEPVYHAYYDDGDLSGAGPLNSAKDGRAGSWTFYHANGARSAQGTYLPTGEKQGTWSNWYDNGVLSSSADHERGVLNGPFLTYHLNGVLRDSCMLRTGKRQGTCCAYRESGGTSACKVALDDQWHGPVEEFHPTGARSWRYTLSKAMIEGAAEQFFADGTLQFSGTFLADKRNGTFLEYHPNGNKAEEYTHSNGIAVGPFTEWHSNGAVRMKGKLVNGQRTGELLEYDAWGTLVERRNYDDQGRLHGPQETMDARGRVYLRTEQSHGSLIRYTYVDPAGKVLSEGTRSKGRFDLVGYTPEGTLNVQGTYLDEGLKDGTWKYFHPDGTLESQEELDKGRAVGEQRYFAADGSPISSLTSYSQNGQDYERYEAYHPSGGMKEVGQRKDRTYEGVYTRYAPDGTVLSVEYFEEGDRSGWQEYFDASGILSYTERIENGALVERTTHDEAGKEYEHIRVTPGPFVLRTRYPGGQMMMEAELLNGRYHGTTTWYYPDGKVEVRCTYLNDERHGKWTSYHPNGKVRLEQHYRSGTLHGTSTEWFMTGGQKAEFIYRDGQLEGTATELHENGRTAFIRDYSNGELHGRHMSHDHAGVPQLVRFYHKGDLLGYASVKADGSFTDTVRTAPGVARIASNFPDGGPARIMHYRNGDLHGEFIEYHSNGKVMETSTFRNDAVVGESKEYHANGTLFRVIPYVDGLIHGEVVSYHENGKEQERSTYRHGLRHGAWKMYDPTGKEVASYRVRSNDVVEVLR